MGSVFFEKVWKQVGNSLETGWKQVGIRLETGWKHGFGGELGLGGSVWAMTG